MVLLLWFWFFVHPIVPTRIRAPEEHFAGVCLFLNPVFLPLELVLCKEEATASAFFKPGRGTRVTATSRAFGAERQSRSLFQEKNLTPSGKKAKVPSLFQATHSREQV
jgi:hypothetical protein